MTYYYKDNNGNEQKYVGQIYELNGVKYGMLTENKTVSKKYDLTYHAAVEGVKGYSAYFTDANNNIYTGRVLKNDSTYYYKETTSEDIQLIHHPITENTTYFTYKENDVETIYTGEIEYDEQNNCYIGK